MIKKIQLLGALTLISITSSQLYGSGFASAGFGESSKNFGDQSFTLQTTEKSATCARITLNPESYLPGSLYNVYRWRKGNALIQISPTIATHPSTVVINTPKGPVKTAIKKNTNNVILKGSKKDIQPGDIIFIDGWATPHETKNGINYFNDAHRVLRCYQIHYLPKRCTFYVGEKGISSHPKDKPSSEFGFKSGIVTCSKQQKRGFAQFLIEQQEIKAHSKKSKKK